MKMRDEILLHRIINKMFLTKDIEELFKLNNELILLVGKNPKNSIYHYIATSRIGERYYNLTQRYILE